MRSRKRGCGHSGGSRTSSPSQQVQRAVRAMTRPKWITLTERQWDTIWEDVNRNGPDDDAMCYMTVPRFGLRVKGCVLAHIKRGTMEAWLGVDPDELASKVIGSGGGS